MTTSRERVEQALARVAETDPLIRSVCTLDPTALAQADARDAESPRGPLHGHPVLIKDNVDTAGLATTAGSLALAQAEPPAVDAPLVARLRAAGLVVLGKTNLSEWANFRDGESTSGWSAYGGLTRNPYALNRSAGGSSSGSGAAVGAGLVDLAIGTETDGSITCPAALNGCVGLKPTVGLVPAEGVVPISPSQDSPGPMTATVAQARALLAILADDPTLARPSAGAPAEPLAGLAGRRIGVPRAPWWGYSRHADAVGEEALGLLAAAGVEIVDDVDLGPLRSFEDADELLVLSAEFRAALPAYLATRSGAPRDLAEVIAFNRAHAEVELAHFGQSLLEACLEAPDLDAPAYLAARDRCRSLARTSLDDALARHRLDALLTPSYAPAWPIDLVSAEAHHGACSQPTALAGYPLLTLPIRLAAGLPMAVSLWGTAGSEDTLLTLAAGLEALRDRDLGPLPAPTFPEWV